MGGACCGCTNEKRASHSCCTSSCTTALLKLRCCRSVSIFSGREAREILSLSLLSSFKYSIDRPATYRAAGETTTRTSPRFHSSLLVLHTPPKKRQQVLARREDLLSSEKKIATRETFDSSRWGSARCEILFFGTAQIHHCRRQPERCMILLEQHQSTLYQSINQSS